MICSSVLLSVHQTQAAQSLATANGQQTLLFVGDSLTVGTSWFGSLKSKIDGLRIWNNSSIDAKVGRLATEGAVILKTRITAQTTAIVVALGTNDMISRRDPAYPPVAIDAVMQQARNLPVLWFNVKFSPTGRGDWRARGRRFDRALRAAQSRWPNLVIANWYSYFTPSGKARYIEDGVHLNVSGYKARATFTIAQLKSFGNAIVNATTTTTTTVTSTTSTTISPTTTTVPSPTTT
jgi:lysophospholipase L1-like esterase